MPGLPLKLNRDSTTTTPVTAMPGSTSLQDIRSQKYWTKEQRLISLPESFISIRGPLTSDDRVFEHPEVTVKASQLDDELQRRLQQQQSRTGSVPNLIEHPDIRQPLQIQPVPTSTSKIIRKMSADANNNRRSTSPPSSNIFSTHQSEFNKKEDEQPSVSLDQNWFKRQQQQQEQQFTTNRNRADPLVTDITDILENSEHKKNDINPSITNGDDKRQHPVQIIREYSDTSTVSDDEPNRNKSKTTTTAIRKTPTNGKSPSDDDFW
ncbi:unnamed protein product [Didymodactylos carnosus]|uniref:Uncharacterized protein n=1 Tax=Didymodactylos carnosus TaxID=1234261 RepID=A0A814ETW6_9BILA|nr:unnamed protein product [Didymodactylos carnosus]CAF0972207.1 unnamed protein product [Didymodactylos carnosus]CAF3743560.1 unnamed protein product [Didymodactylos carnosus]CAF3744914.1 unnamed protein product [Didymodactylos carnosus]